MRPTAGRRSPARSCRALEQPLPDCRGQVRRLIRVEPGGVDLRNQRIQRAIALARRGFQRAPKRRFQADRGLMAGDQDRSLLGRRVRAVALWHQYMCWPPLIDRVEPVTKPPFSSTRKATPRAISSALPSRPTGIFATILPSTSSGTAATMSVSMYPGAIALTVTLLRAPSCAKAF